MDPTLKIDIIESSLPEDMREEFKEKFLKNIFVNDANTGIIRPHTDYKIVMYNKKSSIIPYLQSIDGWKDVSDVDYFCVALNRYNDEQKSYTQKLMDVDRNLYNTMHFYISMPPSKAFFLLIYGKKNPQLSRCVNDAEKNNTDIVTIKNALLDLENECKKTEEFVNKELITTSKNFNINLTEGIAKTVEFVKVHVEETKLEQDKFIELQNNILDKKLTTVVENAVANFDNRVCEMEKENTKVISEHEKNTKDTLDKIALEFDETSNSLHSRMKQMETFTAHRDSEYLTNFEKIKSDTEESIQNKIAKFSEEYNESTEKISGNVKNFITSVTDNMNKQNEIIETVQSSNDSKINEFNTKLLEQINTNQKTLINMINEFRNTYNTTVTEMKKTYDTKINAMQSSFDDVMNELHPDGNDMVRY